MYIQTAHMWVQAVNSSQIESVESAVQDQLLNILKQKLMDNMI